MQDIIALKVPKTLSKLRSFIGSINQLAKFMKGTQELVAAFRDSHTASNKLKFHWTEVQSKAFEELKQKVAQITQNYHYNPKRETRLKCDARKMGLGACLEQKLADGTWVPIFFASRQLNPQEMKYSTNELELLAVVWSTYHFRYYLYGNRFELITDHKALLSALRNNRANKTYQSRLIRWVDKLLPFDFTVNHLAGKEMGLTNYLSRDASGEPEPVSNCDEKFVVASMHNFFSACDFISQPNILKSNPTSKALKTNFIGSQMKSKPVSTSKSGRKLKLSRTLRISNTNKLVMIKAKLRKVVKILSTELDFAKKKTTSKAVTMIHNSRSASKLLQKYHLIKTNLQNGRFLSLENFSLESFINFAISTISNNRQSNSVPRNNPTTILAPIKVFQPWKF